MDDDLMTTEPVIDEDQVLQANLAFQVGLEAEEALEEDDELERLRRLVRLGRADLNQPLSDDEGDSSSSGDETESFDRDPPEGRTPMAMEGARQDAESMLFNAAAAAVDSHMPSSVTLPNLGDCTLTMGATATKDGVKAALRALRTEAPVEEIMVQVTAAKEELVEHLFSYPVPEKAIKDHLRIQAMSWLLVIDYVRQEVSQSGSTAQISRDPGPIVRRIGDMAPHKICQFAFKRNDIVWICKNCQKDETCVLCNECFRHSKHDNHEVYFYHTQAGGCCDCGDQDAWDAQGFCHRHGQDGNDPLVHLPPTFIASARHVLGRAVDFLHRAVDSVMESYSLEECRDKPWVGHGDAFYLILRDDDVHTKREYTDILSRRLQMSTEVARTVADQVHEQGESRVHFGPYEEMRQAGAELRAESLLVSLLTKRLHKTVKVAVTQVNWLYTLAGVSRGICRLVVEHLDVRLLNRLMQAHGHLPKTLASALHTLYLFLMADQVFKSAVAQSYAETYLDVTEDFARGIGVADHSLYSLSVQFLNRSAFVNDLVSNQNFLETLIQAARDMLDKTLIPSSGEPQGRDRLYGRVNVSHPVLKYRRYSPVVADLKFVLQIPGVSALFAATCMDAWTSVLEQLQYLHSQYRETNIHVAYETRDWMFAFNVHISLCHVLDCLLTWVRAAQPGDTPSVIDVARQILVHIDYWQAALLEDVDTDPEGQQDAGPGLITLPTYPNGSMTALTPLLRRSFHIILHRSLAFLLREATKNPTLAPSTATGQPGLTQLVMDLSARPLLRLGLVETLLMVLTLNSEIRAGLWRRNGHTMVDQVVNYAEPPFCRVFRDMDLLLLQLAALAMPASDLINLILHRYRIHTWLLCPPSPRFQLDDQYETDVLFPLADECLHLLILLATELPLPPLTSIDRLYQTLLRETVHRLASGPCTHSEINDCCHQFSEGSDIMPESMLDTILSQVAERREAKDLEPEKFVLKPSAWALYDPAFYHVSLQVHQQASEHRPRPKVSTPLAPIPPQAHATFAPLRPYLLYSPVLLQVIRVILSESLCAAAAVGLGQGTEAERARARARRYQDWLLPRCLHLLTQGVQVAQSGVAGKEDIERFLAEMKAGGEAAGQQGESMVGNEWVKVEHGMQLSILNMLVRLQELLKADAHLFQGVQWLLQSLAALDPVSGGLMRRGDRCVSEKARKPEAKKRQARGRLLERMQRSAANFLDVNQSMEAGSPAEREGQDILSEGSVCLHRQSEAADLVEDIQDEASPPDCMVCRGARGDSAGPLGFAAFCQKSNILAKTGLSLPPALAQDMSLRLSDITSGHRHQGTVVQLCGHALHYGCFDGYFAAVVDQSELIGHLIYDVSANEFPCPYCKSISNALVPYLSAPSRCLLPASPARSQPSLIIPPAALAGLHEPGKARTDANTDPMRATDMELPIFKQRLEMLIDENASPDVDGEGVAHMEVDMDGQIALSEHEATLDRCCCLFLADISHPGTGSPPVTLNGLRSPGSVALPIGPYLGACEALAYTLAVAQAEHGHCLDGTEGPQIHRLGRLIRAMRHVTGCSSSYRGQARIDRSRRRAGSGLNLAQSLARLILGGCSKFNIGRGPSGMLALNEPLLSQNVWCLLVAACMDDSFLGRQGPGSTAMLSVVIRALYLARVLQVLYDVAGVFAVEGAGAADVVGKIGLNGSERELVGFGMEVGQRLGAGYVEVVRVESLDARLRGSRERVRIVEEAGRVFLSSVVLLIQVLKGEEAGRLGEFRSDWKIPEAGEGLEQLRGMFQIPSFGSIIKDTTGWLKMATLWLAEAAEWRSQGFGKEGRVLDYPVWQEARFVSLKRSYTELHSELVVRSETRHGSVRGVLENPAICLVCDEALEAGAGQCTAHAKDCGRGTGVFFLLQDCSVLLVYGERASYFPSPYVDAYGERHKQFRGRPLYLDDRRLETLRRVWARQRLAYEVVHARNSSKHVIHNGYF